VAAALLSALDNTAFPSETVIFGEMALSGEIRPVNQMELRLKEAAKLGFTKAVIPARRQKKAANINEGMDIQTIIHVRELLRKQSGRLKTTAQAVANE
jgi:DNA repair protein RadA/Sms